MITEIAALGLSALALVAAATTAGVSATLVSQIRDSQRALSDERLRFSEIVAAASKANVSLAEQVTFLSDKVNGLDFYINSGNAKR